MKLVNKVLPGKIPISPREEGISKTMKDYSDALNSFLKSTSSHHQANDEDWEDHPSLDFLDKTDDTTTSWVKRFDPNDQTWKSAEDLED